MSIYFLDKILTLCGSLTGAKEMIIRNGGQLKAAYPASTYTASPGKLAMDTFELDVGGTVGSTTCSGSSSTAMTLEAGLFRLASGETLGETWTKGNEVEEEEISFSATVLLEEECNTTVEHLVVGNEKSCTLFAKDYSNFESITIDSGGTITLTGDETGTDRTALYVKHLYIRQGGKLDGVGTGHTSGGPGEGTSSGQGGSYGGLASGVTDPSKLYGSVETPEHYGSNANGATASSGRGGGYIKVVAEDYIQIGMP